MDNEYPKISPIGTILFNKLQEEYEDKVLEKLNSDSIDLKEVISVLFFRQTAILNECRIIIDAMIKNDVPLSNEIKSIIENGELRGKND